MNKFVIGMVAIMMVVLTAFMGCVGDGDATKVIVRASDEVIGVGGMVYVDVFIEPNKNISGAQFNIEYNPSVFSCFVVLHGDIVSMVDDFYFFDGNIDVDNGIVEGVAFCTLGENSSINSNGTMAILCFVAVSTGVCEFELHDVVVGDMEGKELSVVTENVKIEVV